LDFVIVADFLDFNKEPILGSLIQGLAFSWRRVMICLAKIISLHYFSDPTSIHEELFKVVKIVILTRHEKYKINLDCKIIRKFFDNTCTEFFLVLINIYVILSSYIKPIIREIISRCHVFNNLRINLRINLNRLIIISNKE
jgi:hypothetical protein